MSLQDVSRRIFMNLNVVKHKTGTRHLTKHLNGLAVADWYPESPSKWMKRYLGEVWDLDGRKERRADQLATLRAKGKGPPKKGAGKRAQKRKK
ncbi:hypothetical protein JKP88DRAFT_237160 [Tribonema minus]|uniref:Small ribosomal subunit protein mS33 n=1 Tax=Tribonema minus TaxID=303371 RepID=A0A835Z2B4_9STRA|nr:hypothetical protein JKP88DRAFT_237160 [Tribonema minus]